MNGTRILVIEDDSSLRRVLEFNLQDAGYEVVAASTGEEGMQRFVEQLPSLVVTDMKMPGMDGFQVLQEVKRHSVDIPVIIITAFGSVDTAVEAMKLGAYDYITKPFNRDELKLTVAKALQLSGLSAENRRLREELSERADFRTIIGTSPVMERVFDVVRRVADTEATVLINGESGTGKELVARAIHSLSSRRERPFVAINCAAIPRELLESELFGHARGAFTGAVKDKPGKFQLADGGTIFLDEVGDMPLDLQPKLLRALQERTVDPVGGVSSQKVDVRVIAATHGDLEAAIMAGTFREDLYYRISVVPVLLPPLRQRSSDIPLLIRHFATRLGGAQVEFARETLEALCRYAWPGNVRELENTVERLLIMRRGELVALDDLPDKIRLNQARGRTQVVNLPDEGYPLEQLEREVVVEALLRTNWNQTSAARFLSIPRHTLLYRMEKYGITTPERRKS